MATTKYSLPDLPKDASRLLAARVDLFAREYGSRVYASIPLSTNLEEGFRDITYSELARAVDRAAWWLDLQLGTAHDPAECFAYFGPRDLRCVAVILASIKTCRMVLLPSPLLTTPGATRIFELANCHAFVVGKPVPPSGWFEGLTGHHSNTRIFEIPGLEEWFNSERDGFVPYPYQPSWDRTIHDPIFALHSSGSTGLPKLIIYRNSTMVYFDALYRLGLSGTPLAINQFKGKRIWNALPMAHLGGIYANIIHPIYFHSVPVLASPEATFEPSLSDQMILHGNVVTGFYTPALLDAIVIRPESVQNIFKHLESIQYGTAPLNKVTAEVFTQKMNVQSHYASTEFPFPPYLPLEADDWEYFSFHPFGGLEFCHRYNDLFELVAIRREEYEAFQPIFTTMPDATHFYTKDLWSPHPTKSGLWRYRGRTDDIIVTSRGINVHTTALERRIEENPRIRAALVGGHGRTAPYVIIEPLDDGDSQIDTPSIMDAVWPDIQAVNNAYFGLKVDEIARRRVIVAPRDRPFVRLAKGSVDRKATTENFKQCIEACYSEGE